MLELDRRVSVTMPKYASGLSYNIYQVALFHLIVNCRCSTKDID